MDNTGTNMKGAHCPSNETMGRLEAHEAALRKEPDNPELLAAYGQRLRQEGYKEAAIDILKEAFSASPSSHTATRLIHAYLSDDLPFAAMKVLKSFLAQNSADERLAELLPKLEARFIPQPVTFYIPCFNQEKYLEGCIRSILGQTYPIHEILLIDDGSTDGSLDIAERFPVRIIRHERNKGLAAARNTAVREARGDFLASVDTDAVPEETWLERIMANFTSLDCAGVCGKLIESHTTTVVDRWRQVHMKQHWGDARKEIVPPDFLFGAGTVFRTEALRWAGGYNEQLGSNGEDTYISQRLLKVGLNLVYDPLARSRHLRQDNLASVLNTHWRYIKPFSEVGGSYANFSTLRLKIDYDISTCVRWLEDDMKMRRYELSYASFLAPFWFTFANLCNMLRASVFARPQIVHTVAACFGALRYLLQRSDPCPERLKHSVPADLSTLIHDTIREDELPLFEEEALEGLFPEEALPLDASGIQRLAWKTMQRLPRSHVETVIHILSRFQDFLDGMNGMIFRMVATSSRRVEHEALQAAVSPKSAMRIALLNPPWRADGRLGVRAGSRWPFTSNVDGQTIPYYLPFPFFLAYATARLKQSGFDTIIVDAIAEGLSDEEFMERVAGYAPRLILVECSTPSVVSDLRYARQLKHKLMDCHICFAGTHVTALGKRFLEENPIIDSVILGEYEATICEMAARMQEGKNLDGIKGVIFQDNQGDIRGIEERADLMDIQSLPQPERLTLPIYNYFDGFAGMPSPNVQMHASRGCPFGCIFCIWPQVLYGSREYRTRNPMDVVDEMEMLIKDYGFKAVYFDDDTFNIGKQRMLTLCEEIRKRRLNVPWAAMARADTSDFETLKAMKDAGLCAIKFGVESGVQEMVDRCGKGLKLGKVADAVNWCKELGIPVHLTFTFGLPGESGETIRKTLDFAMELDPDSAQFSLTTPFPGTRYFDMLKQEGLLTTEDWSKYDGARYTVIRGEKLSREELEHSLKEAERCWAAHKMRQRHNSC